MQKNDKIENKNCHFRDRSFIRPTICFRHFVIFNGQG